MYDLARSEYAPSNSATVVTNDWLESGELLQDIVAGCEGNQNVSIVNLDSAQARGKILNCKC